MPISNMDNFPSRLDTRRHEAWLRMAVVDDCAYYRIGIVSALKDLPDIQIVEESCNIGDAFRAVYEKQPDILLVGVEIADADLQAITQLHSLRPEMSIVMFSGSGQEEHVEAALRAGASAYLLKSITGEALVAALRAIRSNKLVVMLDSKKAEDETGPRLTRRERQILRHLSLGQSNKQIARALGVAEKTVKQHITRMLEKLGLRNRVEAAMCGYASNGTGSSI